MTGWVRKDDAHPRWDLPAAEAPAGLLWPDGATCSDEAIRTFGRVHIERLLARRDLPPLPEVAWAVDGTPRPDPLPPGHVCDVCRRSR